MSKDMENIFNLIAELGGSDERLGQNTSVFIKAPLLKKNTYTRDETKGVHTAHIPSPDVPELVRYSPKDYKQGMCFDSDGEYARYDQAVAMLAEKEQECSGYRDYAAEKSNQVAALQAELAQIKAQVPVGLTKAIEIIEASFDTWASKSYNKKWFKRIDGTPITNDLTVTIAEQVRLLYAAPVGQTPEIERLREALREVHTIIEHDRTGKFKSAKNVINAALSGEDPS